ncbi:MAG: hypothetical protein ACQEQX_03875 [Thermodesulfobacteriota bacterium]
MRMPSGWNPGPLAAFAALFLLLVSGCSTGLEPLQPVVPADSADIKERCQAHFLHQPWQLVQSATLHGPGGNVRKAIMVLHVHPEQERIKCVITSLEGIVLFKAEYDQGPEILRAVQPFQDEEFARALFGDIRMLLFPPEAGSIETGQSPCGAPACEYEPHGQGLVRVLLPGDGKREILQYSESQKHLQTIEASYNKAVSNPQNSQVQELIPERLIINRHGALGYKLVLELIEAKPLE